MEDILNGLSVCRNPNLANVFYRLQLVEAYGTGIPKIQSAYEGNEGKPDFLAGPTSFKVVLPNMNNARKATKTTVVMDDEIEKVLHYIENSGEATRNEIEQCLGISTSSAIRLMKKMKDNGLVLVKGKGKNVKYIISQ